MRGNAVAAGYCANFCARDSVLSRWKSGGKPDGKAEENVGGAAPARLGVAIEKIGVESELLSPGVCSGKEFNEITGVDKGWFSWDDATVNPWRLGC